MEFVSEDVKSLMAQFKDQEKQLNLKRRWLAGLPMSKSEVKKLVGSKSKSNRTIPESLLREDDVFYETIKTSFEKGVGGCNEEREYHVFSENMLSFNLPNDVGDLLSLLDDMTNNGLCQVADILTRGSNKFEKTRWKMKKIIRELLPKQFLSPNENIYEKLTPILMNPQNFRRNGTTLLDPLSQSYHAAVIKVLDRLDDLPTRALCAMHRKLRGEGYMPKLQPSKSGRGRVRLIEYLKRTCMEMLSNIGKGDDLHERLTKSMAVAGLTLKLILGFPYVLELRKFSPEIESLQTEIAKAIWFLEKNVRFMELKQLQLLLDPNAKLTNRSLRIAIRNLLTEYLFECGDMDTIPEVLLEALAIINRNSRSAPIRYFSEKEIDKEMECILSVSAQTKQIVWDLSPELEFDRDFADLYMEDLEESDDGDSYDDDNDQGLKHLGNSRFKFDKLDDQMESFGETNPTNLTSQPSTTDSENFINDTQSMDRRNSYVAIQEACDETSLVAYRLVGRMLDEFAQIEGLELDMDDVAYLRSHETNKHNYKVANEKTSNEEAEHGPILIQLVEQLMPTFPQSGKERVEEMMGSR